MGVLGGEIIGDDGLISAQGGSLLGGPGLEEFTDGGFPGITTDFSSGLPSNYTSIGDTPIDYEEVGGFTEVVVPYVRGATIRGGIFNDENIYNGTDVEVKLTFAWHIAADTNNETLGPALWNPDVVDRPGLIVNTSQRNANQLEPSRYAVVNSSFLKMPNGVASSSLSAGERLADSTTLHTIGFRIVGTLYTAFFDDNIHDGPFTMSSAVIAQKVLCTRAGVYWQSQDLDFKMVRLKTLELAQGGLWP